jgi:PAS domain S-box-containing protein
MKETVQKLQTIYQNAVEGITYVDPEENIVYANKAFADIIGYEQEQLAGMNLRRFVDEESWAKIRTETEKHLKGKANRYELIFRRTDGTPRNVQISGSPLFDSDGGFAGTVGIVLDVTASKNAEETAKESEEKWHSLFEMAPDGMATTDMKGVITSVNSAFLRLTGYKREDVVGKRFTKLQTIKPKDIPKYLKLMISALRGRLPEPFEYSYVRKDGTIGWGEAHVGSLKKNSKTIGYPMIFREITERKNAEESLRTCAKRYEKLFESSGIGVVISGPDGKVSSANLAAARMLGYSGPKELVGLAFLESCVDQNQRKMLLKQLMGKGYVQGFKAFLKRKDDSQVCIEANITLYKDTKRNVLRTENVFTEISEREKAEEELRESEERFRSLFESIQDPVGIFVGREGRLIDYNAAFKKSSGYTDEELKGKVFLDFVHPDDRDMVLEKYRTEYSEDEFPLVYEIRGLNKKGECIPLELSVSTYKKKGKVIGIEVIHRDLTERKKAEMSLGESQGRFEGLFQGNPEAAAYLGPDYRIQDVNPRFEKLFGYSLEEVNGKHINDVVVPDDRREEGENLDRDARKGYVYRNTVRRKKDGSLVQVSVSAAPIANESGVTGIVAMYKDISDLKNAEKRMDVMNEKLRVVGGLTRHDIRNKLAAVAGSAYLLRKRFASEPNAIECLESIEKAVRESERIFGFASAYEKLGVEQLVYVDAKKILEEAIALFPDLKGVRIVNDCDGLTLLADSLLRQLFYNLIDNSLKYGQKATQIRIHYEKTHDNELRLACEDDGIGISKDAKPKLFNEGFTTGKGSGHGLYLIRKMMDVYGWTIDETGEPGKGARFTISIPETKPDGTRNYRLQ